MPVASSSKTKKSRSSRSKAQVQEEFELLAEKTASVKEDACSKNDMAQQIKEAEIKNAVSEITVEVISKKIANLKSEISSCLSGISEKMTCEIELLANLKEAVRLESLELEKLYGVDIASASIDQLILDYNAKKQALENEIQTQKAQWESDQLNKENEELEYQENLTKNRKRENDEYEYRKNLERKKIQDKYEEEIYLRQKQNFEKQQELDKNWKEREEKLHQQEEEFLKLQEEVAQFPAKLEKEREQAAENSAKQAHLQAAQEINSLKKDLQVEKQLADLRMKTYQETINAQENRIDSLQQQLAEAKQQVQDIALKAIEGASGSKALAHVNQIAIEQAKTRNAKS